MEEARAGCLRRAGALVVIDGIVHRPTGLPMLHLQARSPSSSPSRDAPAKLAFGWSLGDGLASDSSQNTMPAVRSSDPYATELWLQTQPSKVETRGVTRMHGIPEGMGRHPSCLSFPLGDARQAVGFAAALADAAGGMPRGSGLRFEAPDAPMARFDPDFFPEDPLSTARALASLRVDCYAGPLDMHPHEPAAMPRLRRALDGDGDLDQAVAAVEAMDLSALRGRMGRQAVAKDVVLTVLTSLARAARDTLAWHRTPEPDGQEDEVASFRA